MIEVRYDCGCYHAECGACRYYAKTATAALRGLRTVFPQHAAKPALIYFRAAKP